MLIYLGCFAVSVLLLSFSNKFKGKNQKRVIAFIGILLPCVLAGLRDESIGTDVMVYVKQMFDGAKSTSNFINYLNYQWFWIWKYKAVYEHEIGFTVLVYIITKITGSLACVLFSIELFISTFIYKGIKRLVPSKYVWIGMLTFYLMFYNNTLNMMRQWMAMSLLLYGFSYLIDNKRRKYFITVICGCLFHMSAVIGLIIYAVFAYVKKRNNQNNVNKVRPQVRFGIVLLISLLFIILAGNLGKIMYAVGLGRFGVYLDGDFSLLPNQFLIRLPMFIILAWSWKHLKKQNEYSYYYLAMMWIDLVLSQLISINSFAIRIPYFFSEFFMIINPSIVGSFKSKEKRTLIVFLMTAYLVIYWLFFYVYKGSSETVPYVFGW